MATGGPGKPATFLALGVLSSAPSSRVQDQKTPAGLPFPGLEWEEARPEGERPFKPWKMYSTVKYLELRQGQKKAVLRKGVLPSSFGKGHVFPLKPQGLKETPKGARGGSPEVLTHSQGGTVAPKGLRTPRDPFS